MNEFFFEKYQVPLIFKDLEIKYKKVSDITDNERIQLAKMYCTMFNSDNKNVLRQLNIRGRIVPEGLWTEEPYSLERCVNIIKNYMLDQYFGVVAYTANNSEKMVLGATIFEERSLAAITEKGYKIPFNFPDNVKFWCVIDTFRRDVLVNNKPLKYLANKMTNEVINLFKKEEPILMYSSTNSPIMVKSWKKDGWTIIEKETTFGNKFQAFKLNK
jgi:hypothetical protein